MYGGGLKLGTYAGDLWFQLEMTFKKYILEGGLPLNCYSKSESKVCN